MSKKKLDNLRNLSVQEMKQKVNETERDYFANRVKLATGQLEKTAVLWKQRKEVARLKTFLTQKESKN